MLIGLFLLTNLAAPGADTGASAWGHYLVDPNAYVFTDRSAPDGDPQWTHYPDEIPLPAAVWMGIAGLLGVAGFGAARRRRLQRESGL